MKLIKTENSVGHVLCHDLTQIIKDVTKDARFRKGHVVVAEDIPVLLSMGKENLYVWEKDDTLLHEDEAAEILCSICQNENMKKSEAKEGKIELTAEMDGLFVVERKQLDYVNSFGQMMIATRSPNTAVKKGDKLCGTRIIPLVIEKEKMQKVKADCGKTPILALLPFNKKRIGIVTTGNEVFKGIVKDTFGPVVTKKVEEYGGEVMGQAIVGDDHEAVTLAIKDFINKGANMVLCTGGMSVDPDDKTPLAIKNTGADIISYGAPVLPGAMFLLSYYNENVPVVGLPGCVMYAKRTIFDVVLPLLMADKKVNAEDLAKLGAGGLCLNCETCHYPNCGFGKGW